MASAAKQDERLNHDDGAPQAPDQLTTNQAPAQAESSAAETITTSAEQNIAPDIGIDLGGYISDSAKTVAVGEISPRERELMEVTQKCLDAGIDLVLAGL